MFIMDVPDVPAQNTHIVLAQTNIANGSMEVQPDYILNACQETDSELPQNTAMSTVDPAGWLEYQLAIDSGTIKNVTLLESPTHGKLNSVVIKTVGSFYRYVAEPHYVGRDKAEFMAEYQGKLYKIVVNLIVHTIVVDKPECPDDLPKLHKVKRKSVLGSSRHSTDITVNVAELPDGNR